LSACWPALAPRLAQCRQADPGTQRRRFDLIVDDTGSSTKLGYSITKRFEMVGEIWNSPTTSSLSPTPISSRACPTDMSGTNMAAPFGSASN